MIFLIKQNIKDIQPLSIAHHYVILVQQGDLFFVLLDNEVLNTISFRDEHLYLSNNIKQNYNSNINKEQIPSWALQFLIC